MRNKLNIGLFGFGVVGNGLYEVLNQSNLLDATIKKIVVKNPNKDRKIAKENFSYDKSDILLDNEINVVVELIDDANAAYLIVSEALKRGKHVVTANKKMLAENLDNLLSLAKDNNASLLYEASVGGSIPIIRNLEEYYNNDSLSGVQGIVNGTTNYILTQTNYGKDYDTALAEATELGFAESDPTLDVDGFDSKFKLVLLIKHAFGLTLKPENVFNYGIRHIKAQDVKYATEKGFRLKLFSRAEKVGDKLVGFVAPHFISEQNVAYNVNNEFNAVTVEALFSDKQLFLGKGAGAYPTASAVLSDISALQYDYAYEYKKTNPNDAINYSEDFFLKIYLGSEFMDSIQEIPFYKIDEVFQSKSYNYQSGWVKFSELRAFNFNQLKDLFFAVLPEPFLSEEEFAKEGEEHLFLQVFNS
ncbi:MAG: homoserine dehydrogenase [Flavobacteriia bacterium]|jgi:homoserine dehydrogenase